MTERLFLEDSASATGTATVRQVDAAGIVLDRTLFYPRSGGQPGDTGRLTWSGGETAIADTIKGEGDSILHIPAADAALPPTGAEITWRWTGPAATR